LLAACGESSDPLLQIDAPTLPPNTPRHPPSTQPAASAPVAQSQEHISAADPRIRYTGRIDYSDPARPAFDWPAISIEAAFEGTSLAILLQDGQNSYNVTVDGQESVLHTRPGENRYVVAEGLSDGRHTFRMIKRTETFFGTPVFLGFELDAGRDLASLPSAPDRRIEFVGDSITAGYGSEGKSPTCSFSAATENVELTYAAMAAEELEAGYTIVAVSGVGIVRNFNTANKMSPGTMLTYYDLTTTDKDSEEWDFNRWVPDAVVINLGTNDFSTAPHPAGEVFLQGYTELIIKVRNRYPDAHIFAMAGPIMVDPAEGTIRSVVTQMREILDDDRVHFVKIENNLELSAVDYGCDWHPNGSGHRKIAEQLIPRIREVMNW
jgi:lysophospholipase L1-like esterase